MKIEVSKCSEQSDQILEIFPDGSMGYIGTTHPTYTERVVNAINASQDPGFYGRMAARNGHQRDLAFSYIVAITRNNYLSTPMDDELKAAINKWMETHSMNDQEKLALASKAIDHALRTIIDDPRKWYHLGYGTQTYALLTEAHAEIHGKPVDDVQEEYLPDPDRLKHYIEARDTLLDYREETTSKISDAIREVL